MKPEQRSKSLLSVTRSKAKMYEYGVPSAYHIKLPQDPAKLLTLTIGILGELAAIINRTDLGITKIEEGEYDLLFSARFFDAYLQSKLNENFNDYLLLLGSASYYLCDLAGSSSVLTRLIGETYNKSSLFESLLLKLLSSRTISISTDNNPFGSAIASVMQCFDRFYSHGNSEKELLSATNNLIALTYESGTARELLLADVISAVIRKKIQNSSWKTLPTYSGIDVSKWQNVLLKDSFIKELWPAQHLLGLSNIYQGESAVIQMPTSAGKTKAVELIIRSSFLADRTSLVIVIAPFRALCHEIKNDLASAFNGEAVKVDELSDVTQVDFKVEELLTDGKTIVIVTPEKLLYMLRHEPSLGSNAKLLIFDEGHQFDSGVRGINYELLITSLRTMLAENAQKVLISAVISNGEALGEWLNGSPKVVAGKNLSPTYKSIGFTSWKDSLGRIEYVVNADIEKQEFFVPRVLEQMRLPKRGRERKQRFFPEKDDGQAIALFLGIKLANNNNGSVAIFCGRKDTAGKICELVVSLIDRGLDLPFPHNFSDPSELEKLQNLYCENLGTDSTPSRAAKYGIFAHHGNTPHGIRLAVEHAMRVGSIRFVVCTSTLAQGVNLPIRYLIVTSVYQGLERIKVRDFHNLIGRAGRAGMHTEGSVLFADPDIYDQKGSRRNKWRWEEVKNLLEPSNSEPCISNLLSIFDPIESDDGKSHIKSDVLDFVRLYIEDPVKVLTLSKKIAKRHATNNFSEDGVERQISWKISLICSVESFLLAHWDEKEVPYTGDDVVRLAENTLAFHLADESKREAIRELFRLVAKNISALTPEPVRRKVYGRILFGLRDSIAIEAWVRKSYDSLISVENKEDLLTIIWPLLCEYIRNRVFKKIDELKALQEIVGDWIEGKPFHELFSEIEHKNITLKWGKKRRRLTIDQTVEIFENGLAYEGALLIGAVGELLQMIDKESKEDAKTLPVEAFGIGLEEIKSEDTLVLELLQLFQKQIKYGLPTNAAVSLYEMGFSDRVVSMALASKLNLSDESRKEAIVALKNSANAVHDVLNKYPHYYQERFEAMGE